MNADAFRDERMLFLKELASNPDRDAYELCDTLSIGRPKVMAFLRSYFKSIATFTDRDDQLTKQAYADIKADISLGVRTEFGELNDRDVDNLYYVYTKYRKIDPQLYFEADQVRANKVYAAAPPTPQQVAHDSSNIAHPAAAADNSLNPHPNFPPQQGGGGGEQPKTSDYYNRPSRPPTVNDPSQTDFNVDRLNKGYSYEFLYSLTRIGLLRFVLEGFPYPPSGNKIEGFIQFFELNQDELMASPDALRDRLQKYFGDKTGEQASVAINSYIRYLRPTEKFGVQKLGGQLRDGYFVGSDPMYQRGLGQQQQGNNMYGNAGAYAGGPIPMQYNQDAGIWGAGAIPQQRTGPRWQDPYNTFYHAELVLPYGMSADSPDAVRLIHEWEAKKKRKREEDEEQAEILRKINQKMSFSMATVLDSGKVNGQGGNSLFGPDFLQSLVAMGLMGMVTSGKANVMPYTDESGKLQVKMEQVPQLDHAPFQDPNQITSKDILGLLSGMWEKIAEKSTEAMQARIDGLRDSMGLNGEKKDPISSVGEMMDGLRKIVPGLDQQFTGSGGMNNIEMAKILLERDKFNYDRERSDTLIDHQFEMKKLDKEHEQETEIEANKTRQSTIKGITRAVSSALPQLIQLILMFVSMKNPSLAPIAGAAAPGGGGGAGGGGLGDILGNVFKMFSPGGGGGDSDDEDEDEEGDNPFGAILGGKKGEDEDEGPGAGAGGPGFNLGDIVSQVMPSVMGMMGKASSSRPPPDYPQSREPEIHSGHHHHQNTMRAYDQGQGVRPSFVDVEVGNPQAATVRPIAGDMDNIYENIQQEHEVIQSRPAVNPELVGQPKTVSEVISTPSPAGENANVIKLPRYQEKLGTAKRPEQGVVIPSPREVVDTYPEEEGDMIEEEDEGYPMYAPEDFDSMPDEELREAANESVESMKSAESYMKSVNDQMKKRAKRR